MSITSKFGRQPDPHDPSWGAADPLAAIGQMHYYLNGKEVSKEAFELAQEWRSHLNDPVGPSAGPSTNGPGATSPPVWAADDPRRVSGYPDAARTGPTLDPLDRGYTPCSRTEVLITSAVLLALGVAALLFMFCFAPNPASAPFVPPIHRSR